MSVLLSCLFCAIALATVANARQHSSRWEQLNQGNVRTHVQALQLTPAPERLGHVVDMGTYRTASATLLRYADSGCKIVVTIREGGAQVLDNQLTSPYGSQVKLKDGLPLGRTIEGGRAMSSIADSHAIIALRFGTYLVYLYATAWRDVPGGLRQNRLLSQSELASFVDLALAIKERLSAPGFLNG
ncbi:MAG: hypothetical protein KIT74_00535 [Fimbriimonadales bacterium]|jgi:hypothetical protein|nr:hypothetical protein [Fimbriimonadales bacterium]